MLTFSLIVTFSIFVDASKNQLKQCCNPCILKDYLHADTINDVILARMDLLIVLGIVIDLSIFQIFAFPISAIKKTVWFLIFLKIYF